MIGGRGNDGRSRSFNAGSNRPPTGANYECAGNGPSAHSHHASSNYPRGYGAGHQLHRHAAADDNDADDGRSRQHISPYWGCVQNPDLRRRSSVGVLQPPSSSSPQQQQPPPPPTILTNAVDGSTVADSAPHGVARQNRRQPSVSHQHLLPPTPTPGLLSVDYGGGGGGGALGLGRCRSHSTPSSPELLKRRDSPERPVGGGDSSDDDDRLRRRIDRPRQQSVMYEPRRHPPVALRKSSCYESAERFADRQPGGHHQYYQYPQHHRMNQELRRIASSSLCGEPTRRRLPPTPDELRAASASAAADISPVAVRRQPQPELDVDDDDQSARLLDERRHSERSRSTVETASVRAFCSPTAVRRPGSGRKLPEAPRDCQPLAAPTPQQRRASDTAAAAAAAAAAAGGQTSPASVAQQIAEFRTQNNKPPPLPTSPTAESSSDTEPSATDLRRPSAQDHRGSVSSSSSVLELMVPSSGGHLVGNGGCVPEIGAANSKSVCGADPASDSGHGSGAESAAGDPGTVSGSNSWPDTFTCPISQCRSPSALSPSPPTPTPTPSIGVGVGGANSAPAPAPVPTAQSGLGLLHFSVQYFPVRRRLRVSVIKAERLAGQLRPDLELNAFVKVCLMPGKVQKQRGSRVVKRTRDAAFNEEFFFDNIAPDDLEQRTLRVRLCHQSGKQFQKDVVIGQTELFLHDCPQLLTKKEVKLCQELRSKQIKKLGRLQISTCLESDARRLTVNIFKLEDLPKFGISGPPDPCVRITVDQNSRTQTKQSRTLKGTCNAVFREAVMFLVSTKREDLDRTKIVLTVIDTARTASGDDVIGHVYLGQSAVDKSETDQWRSTLQHPGREVKATHQLKRDDDAAVEDNG